LSLREADVLEHGAERTAMLADAVRWADRLDVPRARFVSRRLLADAHRLDGQWDLVWPLFAECLDEYDERIWRFERDDEIELLSWNSWLVACMVDFPDVALDDIHVAQQGLERRFTNAGLPWHEVYAARREVAAHLGDWPAADAAHLRWVATAPTDQDDRWLDVTAIDHHLAKGDPDRAHHLAAAMLDDPSVSDEPVVLTRCLMLLPLAHAGEWERASLTFRRLQRGMSGEFHTLEQIGRVVEFCALTGNADTGIDWLAAMAGFEARRRPLATMEFATSAAVLADALVRAGRGDTVLDLGADDPNSVPFRVLARRMRRVALDLADRFDRRNGNAVQGDRIRARLAAEPLADFLPLAPTSRPPLRMLPPPGLSDDALLARAEWHDRRCEAEEARACLTVLSDDLPPQLDARLVELRAKFFQSEDTEPALRHAIRVHRRHGDEPRALLAECWLGLWVAHDARAAEGVATVMDAVGQLRRLGNDSDCAWGEYWLAYLLAGQGAHAGALDALARGRRHAEAAADHLALGTLLTLDATLNPSFATATAALDALVAAGAPEKALEALEELTRHDGYLDVVEKILADPPRDAARLVGRLRYLRACARFEDASAAELADDLNEAIGQATLRGGDAAEQWHQLAQATHATGRFEDAVDASTRAAAMLDHLRDTVDEAWADPADQARFLLAESYRQLGDHRTALREYRKLADGTGPLAATAFVAGTALLEELDITEWPA
jgi:tetratricopeptide (TPR) repeat protein